MNENERMRRLLYTLDAGDDTAPPYADELWDELATAYDSAVEAAQDPTQLDVDVDVVIELEPSTPEPPARRFPRRGLLGAVVAAAAIALAIVVADWPGDDPTEDVSSSPSAEICEQYRAAEPSIRDLIAAIESDQPIAIDDVRAVRESLDTLRDDLEGAEADQPGALRRYASAAAVLSQAELEVQQGLLDQASRTLTGAANQIEFTGGFSEDGSPQPDRCTSTP